jgi:hypothetical protein
LSAYLECRIFGSDVALLPSWKAAWLWLLKRCIYIILLLKENLICYECFPMKQLPVCPLGGSVQWE